MTDDQYKALIALNRFGLGAKPGDLAQAVVDPLGFVLEELEQKDVFLLDNPALPATKHALEMFFDDPNMREEFGRGQKMKEASTETSSPNSLQVMGPPSAKEPSVELNSYLEHKIYRDEAAARFHKQISASCGLVERLVAFWSNHFAVAADKDLFLRVTVGAFEREAIRPHVLGRFEDMLKAVEQHPAMVFMLDNMQSIGPCSATGIKRGKGLNENFAREILELHTVGVDNYTQADVICLAGIMTGWTFSGPRGRSGGERGTFTFVDDWHEPGAQSVLGVSYSQAGKAQGEAALHDFAVHPATAIHIATKLIRHFISDDPPVDLIEKLAKVFRDSEGDLKAVTLALLKEEAAWQIALTKMRNPQEYMIAALRSISHIPSNPITVLHCMIAMGMPLWDPLSPKGFDDIAATWASPICMKSRLDMSAVMARRMSNSDPLAVLDTVAGSAASKETREAIERAESREQAFVLLLMSPEFQRR